MLCKRLQVGTKPPASRNKFEQLFFSWFITGSRCAEMSPAFFVPRLMQISFTQRRKEGAKRFMGFTFLEMLILVAVSF